MAYKKPSRYTGMPNSPNRRYATAAIVIGGATIGSSLIAGALTRPETNVGVPVSYNGQQYYIPGDSQRVLYPSKEACMKDVPWDRQVECEPANAYRSGSSGWYGPVYRPGSSGTYTPSSQYPSEKASSANTGKRLPSVANTTGFGSSGKAISDSGGS